eukprot:6190905-Pleurochrysis_carterae.AAC.1
MQTLHTQTLHTHAWIYSRTHASINAHAKTRCCVRTGSQEGAGGGGEPVEAALRRESRGRRRCLSLCTRPGAHHVQDVHGQDTGFLCSPRCLSPPETTFCPRARFSFCERCQDFGNCARLLKVTLRSMWVRVSVGCRRALGLPCPAPFAHASGSAHAHDEARFGRRNSHSIVLSAECCVICPEPVLYLVTALRTGGRNPCGIAALRSTVARSAPWPCAMTNNEKQSNMSRQERLRRNCAHLPVTPLSHHLSPMQWHLRPVSGPELVVARSKTSSGLRTSTNRLARGSCCHRLICA